LAPDAPQHPVIGSDHQLPATSQPQSTRSKGLRVLIWLLVLAVFAAGFFLVMNHKETPQKGGPGGGGGRRGGGPGGPVPVTTDTARRGDIGVYIDAIGTVTPVYT